MNLFTARLKEFEDFHQSMANRLFHYLGLTLVTVGFLGVLDKTLTLLDVSLAVWLLGLALLVDLLTWPKIALPVALLGFLFLWFAKLFPLYLVQLMLLFGFVVQIVAHKRYEKNAPAFATNMIHNHLGPRWLVLQWLQLFGWNPGYPNHLNLNTDVADSLRWILSQMIPILGRKAEHAMKNKVTAYSKEQQRLKDTYGLGPEVGVTLYNDALRQTIINKQKELGGNFAYTSGSTSKPKQILYTKNRLQAFKRSSALSSLQAFKLMQVKNPAMFIFASLKEDDSFASLVVATKERRPGFIEGIIEPAKYLNHPLIKLVTESYGAAGARLLVLALNSPGAIYATNPSTLAVFFTEIESNWPRYREMFAAFVAAEECFAGLYRDAERADWLRLICALARGDYGERVKSLAASQFMPDMQIICPDLKGYICWDGGYVTGFLGKIYQYLPPQQYLHIPMFSMSTETMQTELYVKQGRMHFVPTGDLVCYEFLPDNIQDNIEDHASELLTTARLVPGCDYTMVVSDPWGLIRYQTQDVFRCVDRVDGMPDLRFIKRRGLSYSFTGEKITGEQVEQAIVAIESELPEVKHHGIQFTLVPHQPAEGLPGYVLVGALSAGQQAIPVSPAAVATSFQAALAEINHEFRDKLQSGRLSNVAATLMPYDDVACLLDPKTNLAEDVAGRSWESQFKLTPLTGKRWEQLATANLEPEPAS